MIRFELEKYRIIGQRRVQDDSYWHQCTEEAAATLTDARLFGIGVLL
jgi:hypothetical protein